MDQTNTARAPTSYRQAPPRSRIRTALALAWKGLLTLGVAGLMGLGLTRWYFGPEVTAYPVVRAELVKTVVASGHVETPYRVDIGSQITGVVDEVLVDEGQSVQRGQPLVRLEREELQSAMVLAEGAVAQAEARMRQMRELTQPAAQETLKQARATLANAEATYERAQRLAKGGFGTQAALDEAAKNLDVARTQARTAELQVYTSSPGGSDYVMAETQLAQARAALATAKARLGYSLITAPRDGVLISRNVEKGAVVQPGKSLLVLAPTGDVQLVVQIDEKNLGLLKVGQAALASADAYPDLRFPATLSYINPSVDINRASVEVKLTAKDAPDYLRQDMTVSVDIEVDRRAGALVAPARVVHGANGGAPFVLVSNGGRAHDQPVKLGLRAGDRVEILDGVKPGDLLLPVSAGVRAGQRIRAVRP